MAITLHHTIVPAHDKETSARFFADIFGLRYDGPCAPPATVRRYDRQLADIFAVQDEVTRSIIAALEVKLTLGEQRRVGPPVTT